MDMDTYRELVAAIPEMKKWTQMFEVTRHVGHLGGVYPRDIGFEFEVSEALVGQTMTGDISELGPYHTLNYPKENRICVSFIPAGVKFSAFYSLMPPEGTFPQPPWSWLYHLKSDYNFSDDLVREAIESLTRCGKYITRVAGPAKSRTSLEFIFTMQSKESGLIRESVVKVKN